MSQCGRCGGTAEEGFAGVALDGTVTPLFWIEGELVRERLTRGADVAGRERRAVVAHHCRECGAVAWSAP